MRTTIACLLALTGVASAQPGQTPVTPYAPAPYPAPYAPAPYVPPPQMYVQVQLTPEEHELLARGEISDGLAIGGGLASLFVGLGVGQAIQGRWSDTGWIFTVGEIGTMTLLMVGLGRAITDCFGNLDEPDCEQDDSADTMMLAGLLGYTAFRIWGTVDAFAAPSSHNRRVRELHMRLGHPPVMGRTLLPYVTRPRDGTGAVAGLALQF